MSPLAGCDLGAGHRSSADYEQLFRNPIREGLPNLPSTLMQLRTKSSARTADNPVCSTLGLLQDL